MKSVSTFNVTIVKHYLHYRNITVVYFPAVFLFVFALGKLLRKLLGAKIIRCEKLIL